jgi:TIR domain-containing protein/restriction endonuclease
MVKGDRFSAPIPESKQMAANLVIYCLEKITDYLEFERLCHDLMSREGYPSIEPLGGFADKGRDAVHVNRTDKTAIFAYSVREDWRAKLAEDADKVRKHGHRCDLFVFVTTSDLTPGERDEAVNSIKEQFGWKLDLFGLERLRILLEAKHADVRGIHPSIFPPQFFQSAGKDASSAGRDHMFVSYAPEDSVLADWLTRKLVSEGYKVWCEGTKLLGGEVYPKDVDHAIKRKTFRFIAIYSHASLKNAEITRQRALATSMADELPDDFVIPLNIDRVNASALDNKTRLLTFIPFDNWAVGLAGLLKKLETIKAPRLLPEGRQIVAASFSGPDVLSSTGEILFSNVLTVERIPQVVHRFRTTELLSAQDLNELRSAWPFRKTGPTSFLSFRKPPPEVFDKFKFRATGGAVWRDVREIDRIRPNDVVVELIRKSLVNKMRQKGLKYCSESGLNYFPRDLIKGDRIPYARPDGAKSSIGVLGKRKFWRPGHSEEYVYFLAPEFLVRRGLFAEFNVLVRLQLRFTDTNGKVLPPRTAVSRRKHLCRNWWNNHWINRIFAVSQFLADDGKIVVGDSDEDSLVLDPNPISLQSPKGIDEQALGTTPYEEREELLNTFEGEIDDGGNQVDEKHE